MVPVPVFLMATSPLKPLVQSLVFVKVMVAGRVLPELFGGGGGASSFVIVPVAVLRLKRCADGGREIEIKSFVRFEHRVAQDGHVNRLRGLPRA